MKYVESLIAWLLCLCLLLPLTVYGAWTDEGEEEENMDAYREGKVVVSLGDSFASGEGIEGFYGEELPMADKCKNEDWLAHRSRYAWGALLKVPGASGTTGENWGTNWFFAASSGAETKNVRTTGTGTMDEKTGEKVGQQRKDYSRDGVSGSYYLPGQLDVFYKNPDLDRNAVDYVTLSIGGNDVEFEKIIGTAAADSGSSMKTYKAVKDKLDHFYDTGSTYDRLKNTYRRVAEAAPNATIIVTGYPPLLDPSGKNSNLFNEHEAKYINDGVTKFNNRIQALIEDCRREGIKIEFVSVEEEFRGHEAYSSDSYINEVKFGSQAQDLKSWAFTSPYSIHPNRRGHEAYARCVQRRIDELEAMKAQKRLGAQMSKKRNIVLVLDNSGSMEGAPIRQTRTAAKNFIDEVLRDDSSVGIVTFESSARMRAVFSRSPDTLKSTVDGISTAGMTNTEAGIRLAAGMLRATERGQRIIVLMSDGLTNMGLQGEALDNYIWSLKADGIFVYTLGFFQSLYGSDLNEGQSFMENTASPGYHYEVEDPDHLNDVFNDIANQINGEEFSYYRIDCPVDVEVTCNGETLSSVNGTNRTGFGTLSYEAGEGKSTDSRDDRTKILRLREDGTDYEIVIRGNGTGTMDFTAGYMDDNGEYTDLREIKDVPITPQTVIKANTDRDDPTTLSVDADGDGMIDDVLSVGGPASRWWIWLILIVLAAGGAAAVVLLLKKKRAAVPAAPGGYYAPVPARPQAAVIPQAPVQGTVCPHCGAALPPDSQFCTECGASLAPAAPQPQVRFCTNCGAKIEGDGDFCTNCGAKL